MYEVKLKNKTEEKCFPLILLILADLNQKISDIPGKNIND